MSCPITDDQDGAVGIGSAVLADRPEQHAAELSVTATADDEEFGPPRCLYECWRGVTVDNDRTELDPWMSGADRYKGIVENLSSVGLWVVAVRNHQGHPIGIWPFPGDEHLEHGPGQICLTCSPM